MSKRIFANITFKSANGNNRRITTQRIDAEAIDNLKDSGLFSLANNIEMLLEAFDEGKIDAGIKYPCSMTIAVEGERVEDTINF